ncbi:BspA family leucine-rich repeat surface protein [Companilactobacillus huachuanensis]|uniref:BspA family leucine-rich repeat surface protein n=1 Tax=Companilactobacillus huachuanensis TaxID=2559914 RepID=A0ABW1RJS6_9LACO|nr:BspA family leucine-rich repeat surface protein [Companilactobacillus huachuanensis]
MRKQLISLGTSILFATLTIGIGPTVIHAATEPVVSETNKVAAAENEVIANGNDGEAQWSLTSDGTLHISGGEVSADGSSFAASMDDDLKPTVTKVSFEGHVIAQNSTTQFFEGFKNIVEIDGLENFDTNGTTDMSRMFQNLTKLKTVDLNKLNVSHVTNISNIFLNSGLESIDISDWDVSSLKNVNNLFYDMPDLTSVKMFKDFKNISSVSGMFQKSKIKNLDVSDWDMSNIKDASMMFAESSIETLNVSGWNLENANNLVWMFAKMPKLTSINVSNWHLPNDVSMDAMFSGDTSLKQLDLSTWHNIGSSFESGLNNTGITQLKVSADTELANSYFGTTEDEEGDIIVDEEGVPVYSGYLIKVGASDTELIAAKDFTNGAQGTYNYVDPSEITAKATIESNRGDQIIDVAVSGDLTQEFDVIVPTISGATTDKEKVKGKLVATTDEAGNTVYTVLINDPKGAGYVTYTGGDSGNAGGGSNSSNKPEVTNAKRLVSVHADKGEAKLYQLNTEQVNGRALASGSDWYSDQQMVKNGETYYRVATNEWVKASDAYVYESHSGVVVTGSDNYQTLTNSRGKIVSDRALAANSAWRIDRLAYINGDQYYRVATNEFVPIDSVSKL